MANIVAGAVVLLLVGLALLYVYRAKKSGRKCIGCPYAKNCGKDGGCR